jgi:hypothetical protein
MKRMTLTGLVLNIAALALMWASALVLLGMLAASAWALLEFGWSLIW